MQDSIDFNIANHIKRLCFQLKQWFNDYVKYYRNCYVI